MVSVAIVAAVLIPTAAMAAVGTFTSTTVTPAVTGTNSAAVANAKGLQGTANGAGNVARYGVSGNASGTLGIGVQGTGTKNGVFSNGPLGVAAGKKLVCSGCVTPADLAASTLPTVKSIIGAAGSPISMASPIFIGPTTSVTVATGQKLVASVSATLGSTGGATLNVAICFDSGGGLSSGGQWEIVPVDATPREYTSNATYTLPPDTYTVGLCNIDTGSGTLDNNDYVQGWVMVVKSN